MPTDSTFDASYRNSYDVVLQFRGSVLNRALSYLHSNEELPHFFRLRLNDFEGFSGTLELHISNPVCRILNMSAGVAKLRARFPVRARLLHTTAEAEIIEEEIFGIAESVIEQRTLIHNNQQTFSFTYSNANQDTRFVPDNSSQGITTPTTAAINRALRQFLQNHFHPSNAVLPLDAFSPFLPLSRIGVNTKVASNAQTENTIAELFLSTSDAQDSQEPPTYIDSRRLMNPNVNPNSNNDFAVVISEAFIARTVSAQVAPLIELFNGLGVGSYRISVSPGSLEIKLQKQLQHVGAGLIQPGRVRLEISGRASSSANLEPDISFTISDKYELFIENGVITPKPVGDPNFDLNVNILSALPRALQEFIVGLFVDNQEIESRLQRLRNEFLSNSSPVWNRLFNEFSGTIPGQGLIGKVFTSLRLPETQLSYTFVNIIEGAVILQGRLSFAQLGAPAPHFRINYWTAEQANQLPEIEFDAKASWIPGGSIERYRWTLAIPGQFPMLERIEHGRFFTRNIPTVVDYPPEYFFRDPTQCVNWCLEISGTQDGKDVSAWYCIGCGNVAAQPETTGSRPPVLPVSVTDAEGGLIGHLDISPTSNQENNSSYAGVPVLVHMLTMDSLKTIVADQRKYLLLQKKFNFSVMLIVAPGKIPFTVRALRKSKSSFWPFTINEDVNQAWSKTYGLSSKHNTVLVDQFGMIVSQSEKLITTTKLRFHLSKIGGKFPVSARTVSTQPNLTLGQMAPGFRLNYQNKVSMQLDMLAKSGLTLVFWTHWSKPSIDMLKAIASDAKRRNRLCVAIHSGGGVTAARSTIKKHKIQCELLFDRDNNTSNQYGIRYWPTTFELDRQTRIVKITSVGGHPATKKLRGL